MIRRSWTQAASIEETLALWAASLRDIKKRIRPLFRQERVATNAGLFLEGLLGDEQRKTGWMRAVADDDAVLVIDETGFLKQGKASCGVARHWFRRQDHELSDWSLRCLRFAPRSCVHRSLAVSSEGMDRRCRSSGSRLRAPRYRLCDQTKDCDENDCSRHNRVRSVQVGCGRYCLRCWRY